MKHPHSRTNSNPLVADELLSSASLPHELHTVCKHVGQLSLKKFLTHIYHNGIRYFFFLYYLHLKL